MKVFVAVVVIAAFCTVLITAVSDEQNEAWTKELESDKQKINAVVANLTELKVTWVAEVNEKLNSLRSSSLQEIIHAFFETYWTVLFKADGTYGSSCIDTASSSIVQYMPDASAALNKTRDTALDSTYTQGAIDENIQYANIVIGQLDSTLEHLDCLEYQTDTPDYCLVSDKSKLDLNIRDVYDGVDRINDLIKSYSTSAYSTASEANAKIVATAREYAKNVEDTATKCIASL